MLLILYFCQINVIHMLRVFKGGYSRVLILRVGLGSGALRLVVLSITHLTRSKTIKLNIFWFNIPGHKLVYGLTITGLDLGNCTLGYSLLFSLSPPPHQHKNFYYYTQAFPFYCSPQVPCHHFDFSLRCWSLKVKVSIVLISCVCLFLLLCVTCDFLF